MGKKVLIGVAAVAAVALVIVLVVSRQVAQIDQYFQFRPLILNICWRLCRLATSTRLTTPCRPTIYTLLSKNNNRIEPSAVRPVVAPGDIMVTRITQQTTKKSGKIFSDDYSIDFSPCKEIEANFGHVTKLAEKLAQAFDEQSADCRINNPRPEDEYKYCSKNLILKFRPASRWAKPVAALQLR